MPLLVATPPVFAGCAHCRRGIALQRDDIPMRPSVDFPTETEVEAFATATGMVGGGKKKAIAGQIELMDCD